MDDIASIVTQQGELARRRKLLEAMQGQNMGTQIQGGGRGNAIGQALAKVATAYLLAQGGEKLAGEETANREQYQGALQNELGQYLDKRDGSGQMYLPGVPSVNQGTPNQTAAVPASVMPAFKSANPREAIVRAMTSQLPEMQAVGRADFAGLAKQQINPLDLLKLEGYDPKSKVVAALSGDASKLTGKREVHTAGDQIVDITQGRDPSVLFDAREKYGPDERVNGEVIQRALGTGKAHQVANRPASTNVSLNPTIKGEDAFASQLGKDVAGEIKVARDAALQGYNTKATLTQLRAMEEKGIFSGPTANVATVVSNFANTLGIPVDSAKLANTQAYQQQIAKKIADVLTAGGGVGRSMTDEDRKAFMESLPTLLLSPQGRQYVFNQMDRDANIAIQRHKSMQERLNSNPQYKNWAGMLTINPIDDAPGLGVAPPQGAAVNQGAAPQGAIPLDQYLQSLREKANAPR